MKRWGLEDYANYFSVISKEVRYKLSYQEILTFRKETNYQMGALIKILGGKSKNTTKNFKTGNFEIKNLAFSRNFIQNLNDISGFFIDNNGKTFTNQERFISAYLDVCYHQDYNHERFLHKLTLNHNQVIDKKGNPEGYGRLIQNIYNYHVQNENLVMFKNW